MLTNIIFQQLQENGNSWNKSGEVEPFATQAVTEDRVSRMRLTTGNGAQFVEFIELHIDLVCYIFLNEGVSA